MITSRFIGEEDYDVLSASLAKDEYHASTQPEFFYQVGSICSVYEDEKGPIIFTRGTRALRIDIQFMDNNDRERNRVALTKFANQIIEQAKEAGFTELIFCTESPLLKAFCKRYFGFREVVGEMRRYL